MRPRVTLAAGVLALAVALVVVLSAEESRLAGTNNVVPGGAAGFLFPGAVGCQPANVPPGTRSVVLRAAGEGAARARLELTIEDARGTRMRALSRPPSSDGVLEIPLAREPEQGEGTLCARNRGRAPLVLLGYETDDRATARELQAERPGLRGVVAVEYRRGGEESWWDVAGVVSERFAFGKSGLFGGAELWLAIAAILGALALAVVVLARGVASE